MIRCTLAILLVSILSTAACSSGGDDGGKGGNGTPGAGGRGGSSGPAGSGGNPGGAGAGGTVSTGGNPGAGGSDPNGIAGVSRSKSVSSLTTAEKAMLCDWTAAKFGGYGVPTTCTMALISAPANQSACLADFPTCDATVGSLADCFTAVIAAQTACTNVQLAAATTPACFSAASCL
jgi:hypothetical protein